MASGRGLTEALVAKQARELQELADAGCVMAGNAFAPYLVLKGEPEPDELSGKARLLGGADGKALRASLEALGYAPEGWVALATLTDAGEPLGAPLLRQAVAALDPQCVVAEDEPAAQALREAYADELAEEPQFEVAMLEPGYVARVLGMRMTNLGGFEGALSDAHAKQVMWSRLKLLPPLGEPY